MSASWRRIAKNASDPTGRVSPGEASRSFSSLHRRLAPSARLLRTASTENAAPIGKNRVHAQSKFSAVAAVLEEDLAAVQAHVHAKRGRGMSRVRHPTGNATKTTPESANITAASSTVGRGEEKREHVLGARAARAPCGSAGALGSSTRSRIPALAAGGPRGAAHRDRCGTGRASAGRG